MSFVHDAIRGTTSCVNQSGSVKSEGEEEQELGSPARAEEEYTPSGELQEAFKNLQQIPGVDDLPDYDDEEEYEYKPSIETEDQEYQPSGEWTQAFSSLQQPGSGTYVPSGNLLTALASLPNGMVDMIPDSDLPDVGVKIKPEPQDIPLSACKPLLFTA